MSLLCNRTTQYNDIVLIDWAAILNLGISALGYIYVCWRGANMLTDSGGWRLVAGIAIRDRNAGVMSFESRNWMYRLCVVSAALG